MEKIKAVRIMKPGELRIVEEEMPHIDEVNNVLVKVKASGLCGSDADMRLSEKLWSAGLRLQKSRSATGSSSIR